MCGEGHFFRLSLRDLNAARTDGLVAVYKCVCHGGGQVVSAVPPHDVCWFRGCGLDRS